jgi:hypothetical protein
VNVTAQITTKCEMCVTYSATVRAGPGGGIHGGGGFTLSGNVQEGPSTTVGFGFWGANGPVGAMGYVEVDPITRLPNGGGARREGGAGGTFGPQVTFGCTGCASIKYGAQVAQTIAMARALKCIYDQVKQMNQD